MPAYDPYKLLYRHTIGTTCLMRRELVTAVGGFDSYFGGYEDWEYWLHALEKGWKGRRVEEITFESAAMARRSSPATGSNTGCGSSAFATSTPISTRAAANWLANQTSRPLDVSCTAGGGGLGHAGPHRALAALPALGRCALAL